MTDAKEIIVAAIMGLVLSLAGLAGIACADQVLAFHTHGCRPCAEMAPIESQLRREGFELTRCDAPEVAKLYGVTRFPTYLYVSDTAAGRSITGRVVGKCTAGQLRRLCVMPVAASVGSASRNAIRALVTPTPCWGY